MPDHGQIYAQGADQYDLLVTREDHEQNLFSTLISQIRPFAGSEVVEFGAGTGRLTGMLVPLAKRVLAFDLSPHMLKAAAAKLGQTDWQNWALAVADNRHLAVADRCADVSIAGWTFGYLTAWHPKTWRQEIDICLTHLKRVLRPGGTAIVIETLGTGQVQPQPPSQALAAYYARLEGMHGFSSTWVRTDYCFQSLAEAERLTRFFFGDDLADQVVREKWRVLPECTGIWWLEV